jgi:hypothetical protein
MSKFIELQQYFYPFDGHCGHMVRIQGDTWWERNQTIAPLIYPMREK